MCYNLICHRHTESLG